MGQEVKIMSWDLYLGADATIILGTTPEQVPPVATEIYRQVQATNFPERAKAIAEQISKKNPDFICLQEAVIWQLLSPPGFKPEIHFEYDFLKILLEELKSRGLNYEAISTNQNLDIEVPASTGFILHFTDRNIILARKHSDFTISNTKSGQYQAIFLAPIGGQSIPIPRGWASVDVKIDKKKFRLLTTHLDHDSETVRDQQAVELIQLTNAADIPQILTGDFQFDANSSPSPSPYLLFLNAGFEDAWKVTGEGPGFTCCQDVDVLNLVSELNTRPDLILFRGDLDVKKIDLVGESQNDRTSNALWPSTSAGLVADFKFSEKKKQKKNVFDYIVIGAGTAGGVVAKKLTDDLQTSVLVLESGINSTATLSDPNILNTIFLASDNKFASNLLSRLESKLGRQLVTVNGRVIGGSSEVNDMYAVRGSRELYDEWAAISGNDQWNYNHVRSLFIENETYTGMTDMPNERGKMGPIFIRQQHIPPEPNGLIQRLTDATAGVLGIPIVEDYNDGVRDCTFYKGQYIQKEEGEKITRSSTATGYLNESIVTQGNEFQPDEFGVGKRKLTIFAKTTVNKVLFKKKKGHMIAMGVEYVKDGVSHKSFARKGVIVSAGFFSPLILQRSGIGNPADLINAGITPLIENPNVGYNLQTQAYAGLGVEVDTSQIIPIVVADPNQPLILGAFKAEHKDSLEGRRLQILGAPAPLFIPASDVASNGWELDLNKPTNIMSFGLIDLNPRSKGTIMASHSDPEALPSFSFDPLLRENDLDFLVDQYINMYNIIQKAKSEGNSGIREVVYPPEDIFKTMDRNKLKDFVRASYSNFFHYGGQCKMGNSIQNGVVNGFLDVFGTTNLKVADLSIAPILPDGNTSIPAQMIGLNAAQFIQSNTHPYVLDDEDFEEFESSN